MPDCNCYEFHILMCSQSQNNKWQLRHLCELRWCTLQFIEISTPKQSKIFYYATSIFPQPLFFSNILSCIVKYLALRSECFFFFSVFLYSAKTNRKVSVTTILLSWKILIHLSLELFSPNPSMAWRFKQIQLWGNQDHVDQSILSYLPLSKQLSRCM